jgi:hypothetical protein
VSDVTVALVNSPVALVDLAPDVGISFVDSPVAVLDAESDCLVSVASSAVSVSATQTPVTVAPASVTVAVGVPYIPAPSSGATSDLTYNAAANLSGQRVVIYSPGAGGWIYADRTTPAHAGAQLAVTTGAISSGASGDARIAGVMDEPSWSWPAPCPLYLDTTGYLTATPPTSGFLREVARAVSATRIVIEPEFAIVLA